jgi:hypothetical protein
MKCLWKLINEYYGIDVILFMEEGMELMEKCSYKWGWMKCFGTNEMLIIYKWMNEKMHGWMDGLMI